jgi:hypothetical protein
LDFKFQISKKVFSLGNREPKPAWARRDAGMGMGMGVKKRQKGARIGAKRAEKTEGE